MNKELLETLSALREYLLALQANVTDVKKLAEAASQKSFEDMERAFLKIEPYLAADQRSRAAWYFILTDQAKNYLRTGKDSLTTTVTKLVPKMLADLDDIAKKLEQG